MNPRKYTKGSRSRGPPGIPGLQKYGIPRASYLARLVEEKGFWSGENLPQEIKWKMMDKETKNQL